jgi:DNA-binding transcriptional regulator LsrR (DeoR family)
MKQQDDLPARGSTPDDSKKVEMLAVAKLAAEGMSQVKIAAILDLFPAKVNQLVKAALHEQYLVEKTDFVKDGVSDHLMLKVEDRIHQKERTENLLAFLQSTPRRPVLRIFACDAPVTDRAQRVEQLGKQAAPYLKTLLERSSKCGLTWGGMLRGTVSALSELPFPSRTQAMECIPLSGEPLGNEPMSFSSSSLAHDLGKIVNGKSYDAPSLSMVPAFLPEGFTKNEIQGLWKLIGLVRSYGTIFGRRGIKNNEKPLVEQLDMILTSVGPAESPLGFGQGTLFETGKLTIEDLRELVLGDMGGACVQRPDLKPALLRKFQEFSERWTGLRIEHIQACSAQAKDLHQGPPGVVVISGGKARARFIYEIAKRGLINHLIIDDELARELDTIVSEGA